jgi:FSR family fosmidomycin resistance protein-like MFS transporter
MSTSSVLMLVFLNSAGWLLLPVLLALGFTSLSTTPVMLAMVQEHLPRNRAMASGLFISIGFVTRPLAALVIGLLGDNFGLRSAFFWSALVSLLAVPAIYYLPQAKPEE